MEPTTTSVKVLVIGGGPAGSLSAALLARAGVDVLLLEKEVFPRYHIGEALASSCRAVLELAGAVEKVDEFGFMNKHGGLFRWGAEKDWCADWTEMFGPEVRSWSVDRSEFDHLLLNNASDQGARVVQNAAVKRIVFEGDRPVAAEWVSGDAPDQLHTTSFDYVVDASGRAGVLTAQHFRNRTRHEVFRNVAIWGYWDGEELLPDTPQGGSNIISSPDGWYWVIPLRGGRRSVGFVMHETAFRERRRDHDSLEGLLTALVEESDTVRSLLDGDTRISDAKVEQDYSYVSADFCGPGYFVAGDAACFLDPLLSSGVHLASYSALLAAASIVAVLDGEVAESEANAFYESLYRHSYTRMLAMVARMYDQYQGQAGYFWLAQKLTGTPAEQAITPNAAFVEIVGGISDLYDAQHGRGPAESTAAANEDNLHLVELLPRDLYDTDSQLRLVTSPRLGLRREQADTARVRPPRPAADADLTTSR
ncbi:flavin-dependent dehydrogenase [Kitasatospora sp. MAA4]|uniref:NAD(P)/FAD-dependent oxidoreductase n=1 Tax=Kitasatospora sp. MAA4 TaxID=3035093 RepID=UPI0024733162|nr:NAD(P)/FAD-dependent oxidoreductase [Kitasatospora sp. MAA4]MDH6131231.1 flavin-dependent dehydrogenase [Kitasatospora sp. MAA4]